MRTMAFAMLMAVLSACAPGPGGGCAAPYRTAEEVVLFFGRALPGGEVSDADWQSFLDEVLVPAFPEGSTVVDGEGRWLDPARGTSVTERSKAVYLLVLRDEELETRVAGVAAAYTARFSQQSVLVTRRTACAAFLGG